MTCAALGSPRGLVSCCKTYSRSADKTAVVYEERQLNYGSLNAQANRLAKHLRKLGLDRKSGSAWALNAARTWSLAYWQY